MEEVCSAILTAQKLNPNLMEVWTIHAIYKEMQALDEPMDLYRHSLVLKPSVRYFDVLDEALGDCIKKIRILFDEKL